MMLGLVRKFTGRDAVGFVLAFAITTCLAPASFAQRDPLNIG